MKTKFIYVLMATLLIGGQTISAQNNDVKEKKEDKQRAASVRAGNSKVVKSKDLRFHYGGRKQMAEVLMLDDATAAKFTPIYEAYQKELRECRMMNREERVKKNDKDDKQSTKPALTDAEIEKQIKNQFAQARKILDVREKYYKEFSKILSPKQIMKIYDTEKNYAGKFRTEFDRRNNHKQGEGRRAPVDRPAPDAK